MRNSYRTSALLIVIVCTFWGCMPFPPNELPPTPDYHDPDYWVCRPEPEFGPDPCDQVPLNSGLTDNQATAEADCFAVHPTSYFIGPTWIADATLEGEPWSSSMFAKGQFSAFNGTCKIYAPRYRQFMAMAVPFANDAKFAQILDFAYQDVYDAFTHYLQHDNEGRPFFLVGHSQGSWHLERLVREEIEGTALADSLVAAYLPGAVLRTDSFTQIPYCGDPLETGCVVGWNTVAQGFTTGIWTAIELFLERVPGVPHCTNPLSWTAGGGHVEKELNPGSVTIDLEEITPNLVGANCRGDGLLEADPPQDPQFDIEALTPLFDWLLDGDYHFSDYGLYYMSIRSNAQERLDSYLQ